MELRTIVVAVDGSATSLRAVGWAADLAACTGARVVAVHARGLLEQQTRDQAAAHFEGDWTAPLQDRGLTVELVLEDGTPLGVILEVADRTDADLIVIGSRGIGNAPAQLLGSTAAQVTHQAHRPVTIIPADA